MNISFTAVSVVVDPEGLPAMNIDKRNRLDDEIFSYRMLKDESVFLYWCSKQVKVLKGQEARKFLSKVTTLEHKEAQLLMAKLTGNFKRGNERR